MHCSVIENGYDVIEFSNCSTEERGVSRVLLCSLKTKWRQYEFATYFIKQLKHREACIVQ